MICCLSSIAVIRTCVAPCLSKVQLDTGTTESPVSSTLTITEGGILCSDTTFAIAVSKSSFSVSKLYASFRAAFVPFRFTYPRRRRIESAQGFPSWRLPPFLGRSEGWTDAVTPGDVAMTIFGWRYLLQRVQRGCTSVQARGHLPASRVGLLRVSRGNDVMAAGSGLYAIASPWRFFETMLCTVLLFTLCPWTFVNWPAVLTGPFSAAYFAIFTLVSPSYSA